MIIWDPVQIALWYMRAAGVFVPVEVATQASLAGV